MTDWLNLILTTKVWTYNEQNEEMERFIIIQKVFLVRGDRKHQHCPVEVDQQVFEMMELQSIMWC